MRQRTRIIPLAALLLGNFIIMQCNLHEENKTTASNYDAAKIFVEKLKLAKSEVIIFAQRVCPNCCDFYNVFWLADNQRHLTKFHSDQRGKLRQISVASQVDNEIYDIILHSFYELKGNPILENTHYSKEETIISAVAGDCYTQLDIYIFRDSIVTDRMKDHDFDRYINPNYDTLNKKVRLVKNDNYLRNINSKWNHILTAIENTISRQPETSRKERWTLRTGKNEY